MKANIFATSVLALVVAGCATTHNVYPASEAGGRQGVYYALPLTVIDIEVPIAKTIVTPGRLADCVKTLTGQEPLKESVSYSIGDPVISYEGQPDPENVYMVKVKGGILQNRELELELSELGLLTSAMSTVEDKSLDVAITVIKTAAQVAGAYLGPLPTKKSPAESGFAARQKDCLEAVELLDRLERIQELRLNLISGTTAPDVPNDTLESRLAELENDEKDIFKVLFGEKEVKVFPAKFTIKPGTTGGVYNLFSWSETDGVAFNMEYAATSAPKEWRVASAAVQYNLQVLPNMPSSAQTVANTKHGGAGVNGYYYRVPALGRVSIYNGADTTISTTHPIAQFGTVVSLPNRTGSIRKSTYSISLSADTGALLKLKASSTALDPATISQAGEAAIAWAEYQQKRAELEQARRDAEAQKRKEAVNALIGLNKD